MAMHARPLPAYPYAPTPPITNYATGGERPVHPSPMVPVRIPIFALAVTLNDLVEKAIGAVNEREGKRKTWDGVDGEDLEGVEEGVPSRMNGRASIRSPASTRLRMKKLD